MELTLENIITEANPVTFREFEYELLIDVCDVAFAICVPRA